MPTIDKKQKAEDARRQKQLAAFLMRTDGHLGRNGDVAVKMASRLKLSIHTIQSVAMGRRRFRDATWEKAQDFMTSHGVKRA